MCKDSSGAAQALKSMTASIAQVFQRLSEQEPAASDVQSILKHAEALKTYFESLDVTEHPSGSDLGLGAHSIEGHLQS
ncbi:hypothetical protein NEDG_00301 [Nematocida displodere]|uniref:Uncharacterized protein n=1 Tax=Nematocida displodere TaxID=1805483 RepID=A0A177EJE7_9MICR|nr:hypothetical protein NEDG_00301 [Nematocida displodere]